MSEFELRPVTYSRRPTQGFILNIDVPGAVVIGAAGVITVAVFLARGILPGLGTLLLMVPVAATGIVKVHGLSLITWVRWAAAYHWRRIMGRTRFRRTIPLEQPLVHGELVLPGAAHRYQVWEAPGGEAVIWDAEKQTASITCMVASQGLAAHDIQGISPEERQNDLLQFMQVAGSWTRRSQIRRVSMLERTRPGTIERQQHDLDRQEATGAARDSYQEALRLVEPHVVFRPQHLTVTLDCASGAGRAAVKAHGGGKAGVLALAQQEIQATGHALRTSGFTRVAWVSPREWGAWGRSIIDPASDPRMDVRGRTGFAGVLPELAGPMSWDERKDFVETDSAYHRAYWIPEYPRIDVLPGFLGQLALAETATGQPVRHTLQVIGAPTPLASALKDIEEQRETWKTNADVRSRQGKDTTIADNVDWENLDKDEHALIAGHGQIRFSGFVTVSAPSYEELLSSCSSMELAAAQASVEMMCLTYQQGAALIAAAYPAGQAAG